MTLIPRSKAVPVLSRISSGVGFSSRGPEIRDSFDSLQDRTGLPPVRMAPPVPHQKWPSARKAVLFLLGAFLLGGCTIPGNERVLQRVDKALESRKAPSLRLWPGAAGTGDDGMLSFTEARTGLILGGWDSVVVKNRPGPEGTVTVDVKWKGKSGFIASAVPVTADGYFLTAAHCAERDPLVLMALDRSLEMVKLAARIVWRGDPSQGGPDLAILKAPMHPPMPFVIAGASPLGKNVKVAVTGWSGIGRANPLGSKAAGRILSLSPLHYDSTGAAWRIIQHDVPLNFGDSGGPLIIADGRLAGINSSIGVSFTGFLRTSLGLIGGPDQPIPGYSGESIAPDPGWMARIIAADRNAADG